ncbi:MAG: winged helix-turn-helix transcriptional regulator [Deinococcus sp.]|nr:winged helix-turn-helix transcriptional regulator [Deinococcus sp.]
MAVEVSGTKREILGLLKRGRFSAPQLAQAVGISTIVMRRHLDALERDGVVAASQERQPRGRPVRRYYLTERAQRFFPKNHLGLLEAVLAELGELCGQEVQRQVLRRVLLERPLKILDSHLNGASLENRLERLVEQQRALGNISEYQPLGGGAFAYYDYNCLVLDLKRSLPEVLEFKTELFRKVLGAEVKLVECHAGGCTYRIEPRRERR